MSDYDFKNLNDKEFEILCTDLLGAELKTRLERFKSGKDKGVDGRYFSSAGKEVILQCKHWIKTPLNQLITALATSEKPKLDILKPHRYILALSNCLSRTNKTSISKSLSPYITDDADIFGCEDLNDILRKNPTIERSHYKLWINSTAVLELILNRALVGRSFDEVNSIQDRAKSYVITHSHEIAQQQLQDLRVLIITGAPGVGKTTLAEQLCLTFIGNGYQFSKIVDDISEAEGIFDAEQKQLFFFDDFLGRNYLEALTGHEGSKISNFIRRVHRYQNKIFILTSRSTIMNQGRVLIDNLHHMNITRNEFELEIKNLTKLDKARILYNHVWNSDLPDHYIDEIHKDQRYLSIVRHDNFNPRLISYITDASRLFDIDHTDYWSYITKSLDDPSQIWQHPFDAQLDDFSRIVVLIVVLNARRMSEGLLEKTYHAFLRTYTNHHFHGRQDFEVIIKFLSGSLLTRYVSSDHQRVEYDLFNPSIGDFVLSRYCRNIPMLECLFSCLKTTDALLTLVSLRSDERISESGYGQILHSIGDTLLLDSPASADMPYVLSYFRCVSMTGLIDKHLRAILVKLSEKVLSKDREHRLSPDFLNALSWAFRNGAITEGDLVAHLQNNIKDVNRDEEISSIAEIIQLVHDGEVKEELTSCFQAALADLISDNLPEFVEMTDVYSECGYGEYQEAEELAAEMLRRKLDSLGIHEEFIDCTEMVASFGIRGQMDEFFEDRGDYDDNSYSHRSESPGQSEDAAIHDLFDRT